jgi:hypothetical protein
LSGVGEVIGVAPVAVAVPASVTPASRPSTPTAASTAIPILEAMM